MQLSNTPTPTPDIAPAEIVDSFTKAADAFNNMGAFMAFMFFATLALIVIAFIFWQSRNSNSTALSVVSNANIQKDKDIAELKSELKIERELRTKQHLEGLSALHNQAIRSNDLHEQGIKISAQSLAMMNLFNQRGTERDNTEKRMAESVETLVKIGSRPVQEILTNVKNIADTAARIDTRTADWNTILQVIQPLLVELGALRSEAKKHETGPMPPLDVIMPPANPLEATQ